MNITTKRKHPSHCCQKCGEHIGWVGRFLFPFIHKCKDTSVIPYGQYCYEWINFDAIDDENSKVRLCPYWSQIEDKPLQENGYCSYLGRGDEIGHLSLLWDQVKECGINMEESYE